MPIRFQILLKILVVNTLFELESSNHWKVYGILKENVIIKFPSYEKALEWYNSDEYNKIKNLRLNNTEGNLIIIKGV